MSRGPRLHKGRNIRSNLPSGNDDKVFIVTCTYKRGNEDQAVASIRNYVRSKLGREELVKGSIDLLPVHKQIVCMSIEEKVLFDCLRDIALGDTWRGEDDG